MTTTNFRAGHGVTDAHSRRAGTEQDRPPAIVDSTPIFRAPEGAEFRDGHRPVDAHVASAVSEQAPPGTNILATPRTYSSLADPLLALAADVLDDLERTRIGNENRLRQLTRNEPDKDGAERGFGLDEAHPDVARLASMVEALARLEHDATLNLQRIMRRHPLGPWVKAQKGIGDKQGARLIAAVGDPYHNSLHDRPRTVSELWAYCGLHVLPVSQFRDDAQECVADGAKPGNPDHVADDVHKTVVGVAARRRKHQKANWSATAKMRAYLVAESCIKQMSSPYRAVYDARRAHTAERLHAVECVRCGPSGKPAQPGSPWSAGHQHADALRIVAKTILRELWREAKRLTEEAS